MSISGASAARVIVAVASAVFRLKPVRARQAPVRKWVTGSKGYCSVHGNMFELSHESNNKNQNQRRRTGVSDPYGNSNFSASGTMLIVAGRVPSNSPSASTKMRESVGASARDRQSILI